MKKAIYFSFLLLISILFLSACGKNGNTSGEYETAENDPLKARVYTLDNGLKVYMTVYKDAPRIQTFVAVRAGGKNDPAETTGLAHYLEHIMFKGTNSFGTSNYEAEKPLLDQIEILFEKHRQTTDPAERKAIYHQIDSISQEASKYFIPNEYDKLMAAIGAQGTNAFTSEDVTCYVEDIPSNQIENWAKVQSDRFKNMVIRGFHTELEAVYEEKNLSMTRDEEKVWDKAMANLFPFHPYGTQTVIGTQEHLKNPSITNIKKYFDTYYAPNNMAICMSGDFDPDEAIEVIKQYFGDMKQNPNIKPIDEKPATTINEPIVSTVLGNDAESIWISWRAPGDKSPENDVALLADYIFCNGTAGIFDINVNQKQLAIGASAGYNVSVDYGIYFISGRPKQGQTLDQLKDIFLQQIQILKKGDFPDWLIDAAKNNLKLNKIRSIEYNGGRASEFLNAFASDMSWKDYVAKQSKLANLTKKDVVDYANKYFGDNNYTVIYKRTGKDPNEQTIAKPTITPIATNREEESKFLSDIKNSQVKPIEPVFLDFKKDLQIATYDKVPFIYKQNTENDLFEMSYIFEMGTNSDKNISLAISYLKYLGTSEMSPEQVKEAFYKLGCDFNVYSQPDQMYISLDGLAENMEKATEIMQKILTDPVVNQNAFVNLLDDTKKKRVDAKLNNRQIYRHLYHYSHYGKDNPSNFILNNSELDALSPEILVEKIKSLNNYEHTIAYYGPDNNNKVLDVLSKHHKLPANLLPPIEEHKFEIIIPTENTVYFAPYDANQIIMGSYTTDGLKFDKNLEPIIEMYNEYFGGSMNSIVFQEIREARGLAYAANAHFTSPDRLSKAYEFSTYLASQSDKMNDAVHTFDDIINNMPESDKAFELAKQSLINQLRTQRITKSGVIWTYLSAKKLGLEETTNKLIFEKVQNFKFSDIKDFQQKYIKRRKHSYTLVANNKTGNSKEVASYGKVTKLTLSDIFGY